MVPIMLWGWIGMALLLFAVLKPRQAMLASIIGGWLLLPIASYSIPGLPDYNKVAAVNLSTLLGALMFDGKQLFAFRFRVWDLPMVVWAVCPFLSSVTSGLGPYDGLSATLGQTIMWGIPYLLGRVYCDDEPGLRELLFAIVIGGLTYVPLCLYEVRMSPKLHYQMYGYIQHVWVQTIRFGGWRPMVFMQHGLAVGMWMTAAALVTVGLWRSGFTDRLLGMPMGFLCAVLLVTAVMCKSTGAIVLLFVGGSMLWLRRPALLRTVVVSILCFVTAYQGARATGLWNGDEMLAIVQATPTASERADSLRTRLDNEVILANRARQRPLFGWGYRFQVLDEWGDQTSTSDGMWIIHFGKNGFLGLLAWMTAMILPVLSVARKKVLDKIPDPLAGLALIEALLLTLWMVDTLFNAMFNPAFLVVTGSLTSVTAAACQHRARSTRPILTLERTQYATPETALSGKIGGTTD